MALRSIQALEPALPSDKERALARQSSRMLSSMHLKRATSVDIVLKRTKDHSETVTLPSSAFKLLVMILTQMAEGNSVTLIPTNAELTTQQAADLLNVSRPYFIRLLEDKKIPFRKVGTRRKVLFQDVMLFKTKTDKARRKLLDELAAEAQKLGMV
jgi:excisionase family DNA binding protein